MIASTVLLLVLGTLLGATLLFAAVLVPAVIRILPASMARAFIGSVFSLYFMAGASLSGAALALLSLQRHCLPGLIAVVMALCCVTYVLAWRELTPRLVQLRDRGDRPGLRRIEGALQILNSAQTAVITAVFVQVLQRCA